MAPSRASTSIDTVSTGEISDLERVAEIATNKLLFELSSQPEKGNESAIVSSIVDELITHLPGELRRELTTNLEQLKTIWRNKLMEFSERFNEQEPADGDVQDLVGELFTALMTYHSQAVLHHPMALEALEAGETVQLFENGYDAQIGQKHPSLAAQKGLGVGIWGLSFYASWMGITNYWGEFNKWITHKFGVAITPAVSVALRHTFSILGSGWISNFVQRFKEKVEEDSNATGGTTRKGIKEVIKDEHHQRGKVKGSIFIGIAALVLAIDLGTNLNGVVTWFAKRPQVTEQLREARGQIRERLATITQGLEEVRTIPDQVGTQVDDMLRKKKMERPKPALQGAAQPTEGKESNTLKTETISPNFKKPNWENKYGLSFKNPELRTASLLRKKWRQK